ncbi:MAG: hypothetical protein KY468_19035, partial [Armatimonadetes bacterium]|nr:hypothetical protein [Armatimonadota bacterium]
MFLPSRMGVFRDFIPDKPLLFFAKPYDIRLAVAVAVGPENVVSVAAVRVEDMTGELLWAGVAGSSLPHAARNEVR